MFDTAFLSAVSSSLTPVEAERLGIYVLGAVIGLIVTGLIACAKQIRNDLKRE